MKHTRLFLIGASALALGQWANTARAESTPPGNGLEEISDAELGDMRGRYTPPDGNTVAWFGVKMISTWQTTAGQVLEGTMALSMDLAKPQPTVSFVPTVSITHVSAQPPAPATDPVRHVDASGLANVAGVTQSVQVAGDSNLASNVTRLNVQDGGSAPASSGGSSSPGAATAYADGASAVASFDGTSANVLLTIDGQGAVSQWIQNGSIGQSVQLAADNQWVSNRMEIDLIRQSMAANTQLAQNVAQSIALARGIGLR